MLMKLHTLFLTVTLLPAFALAQTETDWLEQTEGFEGKQVGAKVTKIEDGSDERIITISIPKKSLAKEEMEEIVVIGHRPKEDKEPLLDIRYEWVDDFDNNNYGLMIKLHKDQKYPLRIFFSNDAASNPSPSKP